MYMCVWLQDDIGIEIVKYVYFIERVKQANSCMHHLVYLFFVVVHF